MDCHWQPEPTGVNGLLKPTVEIVWRYSGASTVDSTRFQSTVRVEIYAFLISNFHGVGTCKNCLLSISTQYETVSPAACSNPQSLHAMTTNKRPKSIYLIRHAESEENRRIAALGRTFKTLSKFSIPKSSDIYASTELLHVQGQVDTNVSDIGARQISHMREKLLQDNFLTSNGVQLVVHSPLIRARQTSEGMLGCVTAADSLSNAPDLKADSVSRVVQTELLIERSPSEWTPMCYGGFIQRIKDFENWLHNQEENNIVLVGHSQFFKTMLGLNFKFGNCEVWKATFDPCSVANQSNRADSGEFLESTNAEPKEDSTTIGPWMLPPQWSNLEKKYGCDARCSSETA
jgi:broad specificity phosphatase PhoE